MEERRKTIKGTVTLLNPMFCMVEGKVKCIKRITAKILIVEIEDTCYAVAPMYAGEEVSGYLLPIKEKFDELEEVK